MKIGIISDIHAYLVPLQKALKILDLQAVDRIVCAGDLLDGGDDGDAVVKLLKEKNIDSVQGNHDRDIFTEQAWIRRNAKKHNRDVSDLLLESTTVAMAVTLPLKRHYEWEGLSVCLTHGTPWSNTTYRDC